MEIARPRPAVAVPLVFVGGVLGSALRLVLTSNLPTTPIPVGTLTTNVAVTLFVGFVVASTHRAPVAMALLVVGLGGGATTFSASSLEIVVLLEAGRAGPALLYGAASVVAGVIGAQFGLWLGGRR